MILKSREFIHFESFFFTQKSKRLVGHSNRNYVHRQCCKYCLINEQECLIRFKPREWL
jgi:hypothetical protein